MLLYPLLRLTVPATQKQDINAEVYFCRKSREEFTGQIVVDAADQLTSLALAMDKTDLHCWMPA